LEPWTLDSAIEYYAKFGQDHSNYSESSAGMIRILEQIKTANDLPAIYPIIIKLGLFLGLVDIPENIPGWFNKGIAILWTEPNHYVISLGFHERLVVPEEKAIETVKHQLWKAHKIVNAVQLTTEEVQEWEARYRSKDKEDIELLYSSQPHEWLLTNVSLDIGNCLNALTMRVSNLYHQFTNNQLDEAKAKALFDEIMDIRDSIQKILAVSEDLESKHQTDVYLQQNHP
jgi:hypothetical protein